MNARRFILGFVVVYAALMAGGSRFQSPVFRPWEVLAVDNGTGFVPMRVVHMEAIGDLGYKVGAPSLQVPRAVRFSTDQWGLRNFDGDRPFDVVTVGDSFTAGAGVDDSQTLARRLEARTALAVYNFGTGSLEGPAHYLADRRFLTLPPKVVVFCPSQRALTPFSLRPWPRSRVRTPRAVWPQLSIVFGRGGQEALDERIAALNRDNGLRRWARQAFGDVSYRLFGHPWVGFVEGRPALRLPARLAHFDRPPEVRRPREAVNSVRLFADLLRSRGVHLIYCPIPDAGDIYPQLYTAQERASFASPPHVDTVVELSKKAGLDVVDLPALFREHPIPYLYRRDDSHWAPHAIDLAAAAISVRLRALTSTSSGGPAASTAR